MRDDKGVKTAISLPWRRHSVAGRFLGYRMANLEADRLSVAEAA